MKHVVGSNYAVKQRLLSHSFAGLAYVQLRTELISAVSVYHQ